MKTYPIIETETPLSCFHKIFPYLMKKEIFQGPGRYIFRSKNTTILRTISAIINQDRLIHSLEEPAWVTQARSYYYIEGKFLLEEEWKQEIYKRIMLEIPNQEQQWLSKEEMLVQEQSNVVTVKSVSVRP